MSGRMTAVSLFWRCQKCLLYEVCSMMRCDERQLRRSCLSLSSHSILSPQPLPLPLPSLYWYNSTTPPLSPLPSPTPRPLSLSTITTPLYHSSPFPSTITYPSASFSLYHHHSSLPLPPAMWPHTRQ